MKSQQTIYGRWKWVCLYLWQIWNQGSPNVLPDCHASNDLLHRLLLSLPLVTLQICLQLCQLTWKRGRGQWVLIYHTTGIDSVTRNIPFLVVVKYLESDISVFKQLFLHQNTSQTPTYIKGEEKSAFWFKIHLGPRSLLGDKWKATTQLTDLESESSVSCKDEQPMHRDSQGRFSEYRKSF